MSRNVVLIISIIIGLFGWVQYYQKESGEVELKAQLEEAQNNIAVVTGESNDLSTKLTETGNNLATTNNKLLAAYADLSKSEEKVKEFEQQSSSLNEQIKSLSDEKSSLQKLLDDALAVQADTKSRLETAEENSQQMQSNLLNEKNNVQNLKNQLAALDERSALQIKALKTNVQELTDQNNQLVEQAGAQGDELAALSSVYASLKAQLEGKQDELVAVTEKISTGRTALEKSSEALESAITARKSLEEALAHAKNKALKTTDLEQELLDADQEIARRTASLKSEQQRVVDLEGQLASLSEGRAKLTEELQSRELRIKTLTEESNRAKDQIDELQAAISLITEQKDLEVRTLQDQVTLIRMDGDIVFGLGSTRLKQAGQDVLNRVAEFAELMPDRIISLEGHTDNIPISKDRLDKYASNWELSAARAASAVRYLEGLGVDPTRLRLIGYGQNQPVADNADEDGRRVNRRLEIRLAPLKIFESSVE